MVRLSVGVEVFTTQRSTLQSAGDSLLGKMFDPDSPIVEHIIDDESGAIFFTATPQRSGSSSTTSGEAAGSWARRRCRARSLSRSQPTPTSSDSSTCMCASPAHGASSATLSQRAASSAQHTKSQESAKQFIKDNRHAGLQGLLYEIVERIKAVADTIETASGKLPKHCDAICG